MINLLDPAASFRKATLTRLALFADEDLHRRIASRSTPSLLTDLPDAFECREDGPQEENHQYGSVSAEELGWLLEFDAFLNEHYWTMPGFPDADAWSWLYARVLSPPAIWLETTRRDRELLDRFADFDLQDWRDAGYRMW